MVYGTQNENEGSERLPKDEGITTARVTVSGTQATATSRNKCLRIPPYVHF